MTQDEVHVRLLNEDTNEGTWSYESTGARDPPSEQNSLMKENEKRKYRRPRWSRLPLHPQSGQQLAGVDNMMCQMLVICFRRPVQHLSGATAALVPDEGSLP